MTRTTANSRPRQPRRGGKKGMSLNGRLLMAGFLTLALVAILWASSGGSGGDAGGADQYGDLEAVATNPTLPETLLRYKGMTVSFNPEAHVPNWVAWELTRTETAGQEPRAQNFEADASVAGSATPQDYSHSGYDRGHMAPAADMKWDPEAMRQSFYMTNVCPQAKGLNTGAWKKLETKCRSWAQADSVVYIVCGPVLADSPTERIGATGVVVPRRFFKVVLSPYADPPRGIGFIMDNDRVKGGMQAAAVTIDSVEAATGHDFFASLPDPVESELEAQCRFHEWPTTR